MNMIEVKTAELEGAALDWAVATALNGHKCFTAAFGVKTLGCSITTMARDGVIQPTQKWQQAGLLIDHYAIGFIGHDADNWLAFCSPADKTYQGIGPTHLIAACRLIVTAQLGDTVSVPRELLA